MADAKGRDSPGGNKTGLLEGYIIDYISASLARLLAGEDIRELVGSIVNLKAAAAILKYSADVVDKFDFAKWAKEADVTKVIMDELEEFAQ